MKTSCRDLDLPLLPFAIKPLNRTLDPSEFRPESGFDPRRAPISLCHFANVIAGQSQAAGYAAENSIGELRSIDRRIHIIRKGDGDNEPRPFVTLKGKNYSKNTWMSIKIMRGGEESATSMLRTRIRALRKGRGLNQAEFATVLGVSQSSVAKWETGSMMPPASAFVKMSELAEEGERQWWRDRAAMQAGLTESPESNVVPQKGSIVSPAPDRNIPVISPTKVGDLGSVNPQDVEESLRLPANWFSMGGVIRAVRVHDNPISPVISGDYLAILDVSRRDPDRLTDCIVATRTVEGIAARWLRRDGNVYFLEPLREGTAPLRVLKHDGEDSIVGQVLKWIGDAPAPAASASPSTQKVKKARRGRA